jgi:hypothetical protein
MPFLYARMRLELLDDTVLTSTFDEPLPSKGAT